MGTLFKSEIAVSEAATLEIHHNLTVLEEHLSTRTFLVGEKISVADIAIFADYLLAFQLKLITANLYPSIFRWFMTVGAHAGVVKVLGNVSDVASSDSLIQGKLSSGGKWDRHRIRVKELLKESTSAIGKNVTVKGWVRTARSAEKGASLFVELTDGSTVKGLQLLFNAATSKGMQEVADSGGVGASLAVEGVVVASPAKGQTIEIHVISAVVLGAVYGGDKGEIGAKNYPMAKKAHTLEFLREKAHLRPRSKVFSSAMRMRHAMAFATHKFFNERGFVYVHTPIVTAADAEGAGEQFVITTLLPEEAKKNDIPADKKGHVDYSKDFFGRRCCLTVSGQLNVETHACALSDVYTFGPTFRAENSHTARHLAEFWMIEPEICFADLADDMALAVRFLIFPL
jgi:asparaginyl-tRNA synthetase